eukprot:493191-Pyramimonas_sp.AAC.1
MRPDSGTFDHLDLTYLEVCRDDEVVNGPVGLSARRRDSTAHLAIEEAQDPARLELIPGAIGPSTNQERSARLTNSASHTLEDRKVVRVDADPALEIHIDYDHALGQQPSLA